MHSATTAAFDDDPEVHQPVLRRLSGLGYLGPSERDAVGAACVGRSRFRSGEDLTGRSNRIFVLSGWACRCRMLANGRRQIFSFVLPGDPVDIASPESFRTVALTAGSYSDAAPVVDDNGPLSEAFRLADASELQRHFAHLMRLGALSTYNAVFDLLIELHDRLDQVGRVAEGRFHIPVSQDILAEALGVTPVHANRVIGQMRREGTLELGAGWARLHGLEEARARFAASGDYGSVVKASAPRLEEHAFQPVL